MTVFGPDVSAWQEGLVPPEPPGIGFGICRATNGFAVDSTVDNVIAWCKQRKVPFCAYHFVYECATHAAEDQADAFHNAVDADKTIPCMIDWESDSDDNCHPGRPQTPRWDDVLKVAAEIRKLGHKVALLYTGNWYWTEQGKPTMSGQGFDLVNAKYGSNAIGTPQARYAAQGGDAGAGWTGYGGLTPVLWQYGSQITWGNKNLDFNAYRGDPTVLDKWFTDWKVPTMTTTFPYGYSGSMVTMARLEMMKTVRLLHPEFWRRFKALAEFAATQGVQLGVGTGWRVQPDPPPPGFASKGNSNHEGFPADGVSGDAVAIDAVVTQSFPFMEQNSKAYGLRTFVIPSASGYKGKNEPWHAQPSDIPASRNWRTTPWKLDTFKLPTDTVEPLPPEEDEVTQDDIDKIADATAKKVMKYMTKDPPTGKDVTFEQLVGYTRHAAANADKQTKVQP